MLKGARLTITVANGSKIVCGNVIGVGLTFLSGGEVTQSDNVDRIRGLHGSIGSLTETEF